MIIFVLIKICSIIQLTNAQGNYFWPLQWLKKLILTNTFQGPKTKCVDLSSFNAECRSKHCDTTEQYRSIDGCCNNIGYPANG